MASRIGVGNPLFFNVFEIHVVAEVGRVGPSEVLEQLDGKVDGHVVFHAHLRVVAHHVIGPDAEVFVEAVEQPRVDVVHIDFAVHRVARVQFLVPAFLAYLADFFQRIETVHGQGHFG